MKALLTLMVIAMVFLHHDTWNWTKRDLVFGLLPVGLAYQAFYGILASIVLALLVKFAWPAHLEEDIPEEAYHREAVH
jgi:hypothetical protein